MSSPGVEHINKIIAMNIYGNQSKLLGIHARSSSYLFQTNGGNERARALPSSTSTVARRAPVEHVAVPEQIRVAPVEHSAAPGHTRAAISSQLRHWARLEQPFREPAAAPGQGRAAISSQLRLQAMLERLFRASCGSGPGSSGHFEQCAALGQARGRTSAGAVFSSQAGHESPELGGNHHTYLGPLYVPIDWAIEWAFNSH